MKKINILLASLFFVTISCSKFLDVKPVGKLIPTEIKQFDNLLYNEQTIDYHLVCDSNFGSVLTSLSDYVYIDDLVIKYFYNPSIVLLPRVAGYAFQTPYINFNKGDNAFSNGCYKAVGIFNNAIDGVIGLGKENDLYGKEVIAQAKAGRAWSLLVTGMSYGAGYDPHGDNSSKTIPYRTDGDPTRPNPDIATVEELYQNVQKDLEYAIENAPAMTTNPVRANRAAANALMAFMYMNKGDYEKMYTYAKTAWEMQLKNYGGNASSLIYNYNDFKYENKKPLPIVPEGVDVETKLKLETPDNMHLKSYHKENLLYRKPIKAGFSIRPS
ncbi:MAG: RagB/SusD family nutrient uptake outer membrane protein, partial [Rikenellaceae bacterium]